MLFPNSNKDNFVYKVSIIVPCYNTKPWIDECLQSLVDQTLKEIEIICVNDGSTDGTGLRLDEWQVQYPDKIKVIHQLNGGLSNARNAGMAISQGECIGFVDSDDFIDVCMYDKLYKILTDNNADVIKCSYLEFANNPPNFKKNENPQKNIRKLEVKNIINTPTAVWCGLYRKSFINKNNIRFQPNILYEDYAFSYEIAMNSPVFFTILDKLYYYRKNRPGQITLKYGLELYGVIKAFDYLDKKYIIVCSDYLTKKNIIIKKISMYAVAFLKIDNKYKKYFIFKAANSIFNKNKITEIYKIVLTNKYKKNINYLLSPVFILLCHCCYLWQKLIREIFKKKLFIK